MKAIVQDRYGSADVLEFRDIEEPVVGENDVLVRVHAAGCGPDVWHLMTGMPYMARLAIGLRKPKLAVLGWDVAGTVEAVGANVTASEARRRGDGHGEGLVRRARRRPKADELVPKPSGLSFEQAAALAVSGVDRAPGDRRRRGGAAGADRPGDRRGRRRRVVRRADRQGARRHGHRRGSGSKADLVRSLGADDVIDYTREDFTDGTRRWDVIIDTAGRRPLSQLRRALTPKGTLVIVGGDGGGSWTGGFFRGMLRAPIVSLFVGQRLRGLATKITQEDLAALAELVEAGTVTPVIDRTYPLIEAPDAIRYLAEGHAAGKIVVTV